jgi:hypothetical protein
VRRIRNSAQASGIETPKREDLARIDGKRRKEGSPDDLTHSLDPDARITTDEKREQLATTC